MCFYNLDQRAKVSEPDTILFDNRFIQMQMFPHGLYCLF